MELLSKAFGIYQTNCYILKTESGEFIIDAGVGSTAWVCENVKNPLCILNTHGHFDHIWCNYELKERLKIPIYCPKDDAFMLESDCFDLGLKPVKPDVKVNPNEILQINDFRVEFMHFPGHTPGCSMIKISQNDKSYIFSGDFIFYRSIGRSDFPYSNANDMQDSLKRFGEIDYDSILYPGHGESTSIKEEQKHLHIYLGR